MSGGLTPTSSHREPDAREVLAASMIRLKAAWAVCASPRRSRLTWPSLGRGEKVQGLRGAGRLPRRVAAAPSLW